MEGESRTMSSILLGSSVSMTMGCNVVGVSPIQLLVLTEYTLIFLDSLPFRHTNTHQAPSNTLIHSLTPVGLDTVHTHTHTQYTLKYIDTHSHSCGVRHSTHSNIHTVHTHTHTHTVHTQIH